MGKVSSDEIRITDPTSSQRTDHVLSHEEVFDSNQLDLIDTAVKQASRQEESTVMSGRSDAANSEELEDEVQPIRETPTKAA